MKETANIIINLPKVIFIMVIGVFVGLFGLIILFFSSFKQEKSDEPDQQLVFKLGQNFGQNLVTENKKILNVINFILWLLIISAIIKFII